MLYTSENTTPPRVPVHTHTTCCPATPAKLLRSRPLEPPLVACLQLVARSAYPHFRQTLLLPSQYQMLGGSFPRAAPDGATPMPKTQLLMEEQGGMVRYSIISVENPAFQYTIHHSFAVVHSFPAVLPLIWVYFPAVLPLIWVYFYAQALNFHIQ